MIAMLFSGFWEQILGALAILTLGWLWGRWLSTSAWKKKEFKNRILLSLNSLTTDEQGNTFLRLRTLFEREMEDIFHNRIMVALVKQGIKDVQVGDPILKFPKEDAWYVLNAVLNKISEQFSTGGLRKDMGMPVTTKWYTFCLTFEIEGAIRMQKPRIMMIERDKLINFPASDDIRVESEKHLIRIQTLRTLQRKRQTNPHLFMDIELSM